MMRSIDASGMDFQALNELMRETKEDFEINGCLGQRFIGAGMGKRRLRIHGVPGNALGASESDNAKMYLDYDLGYVVVQEIQPV